MLKPERIKGSDEQLEWPAEKRRENLSATVREAVELRARLAMNPRRSMDAMGAVRTAADRNDCRCLLVRYRWAGHVDRRRLCRGRQGRHLNRRSRYRAGCRCP